MAPKPLRYVPDLPFPVAGAYSLDALVGEGPPPATTRDESQERVWPDVPAVFELPPAHLEETLREVKYIGDILSMTLQPNPLPDDNLEFCSDILLSLETRDDLTAKVLVYAPVDKTVSSIGRRSHNKSNIPTEGSQMLDFIQRAQALDQHWKELRYKFHKSVERHGTDVAYPPLVTTLPEGKPSSWKLELNEQRVEESRKLYAAFKAERLDKLSYFRVHRPAPMCWVPVNGDAWKETERSKIESGDLYHSKSWIPLYMDWELQVFDVPFDWKDPNADETTLREREEEQSFHHTWIKNRQQMRAVREEWEMSHQV